MEFVASGIALELLGPPSGAVCGRGAIRAAAMPMPEAAVDEDDRFVFGQYPVRADEEGRELRLAARSERREPDVQARSRLVT